MSLRDVLLPARAYRLRRFLHVARPHHHVPRFRTSSSTAGLWAAPRNMTAHRDKRRKIEARGGSFATVMERKGSPTPPVDGADSRQISTDPPIPHLPEDIWHHIHSLMPMCAAARAACVSRSFLKSWRCRPNLMLVTHSRNFSHRADTILKNHSGAGLKAFNLHIVKDRSMLPYIDGWLQIALIPGIEELILSLHEVYSFPCRFLSDGVTGSIRYLFLSDCAFHPTAELGPFRILTSLSLYSVRITGVELERVLSGSPALEKLDLYGCREISYLKIPCMLLQQLRVPCHGLKLIECGSPNLSAIDVNGAMIRLAAEALQAKYLHLRNAGAFCYAFSELPLVMPNLERLILYSEIEEIEMPMLTAEFLHLRHLTLDMADGSFPPSYDYLSLASYLDASPSLETLFLDVSEEGMEHESVLEGSSDLRQPPGHRYGCLREVEIRGFNSAKSLVELTCCIVKNAPSLEHLVLDTLHEDDTHRCCWDNNKTCSPISEYVRKESSRAAVAIRRYIKGRSSTHS